MQARYTSNTTLAINSVTDTMTSSDRVPFLNVVGSNDVYLQTRGQTRMHISSGGNVAVGKQVNNPAYLLDVNGTLNANSLFINGQSVGATLNQALNASQPLTASPLTKLVGPAPAASGDQYGAQVAMDALATLALVAAPTKNTNAGALYAYSRSGATWSLSGSITGNTGELLGTAIAVSPDALCAVVGCPGTNTAFMVHSTGLSTRQFTFPTGTNSFGTEVAISNGGSYVAIASTTSVTVYSYNRITSTATLLNTLSLSSPPTALALSQNGDYLAVGCAAINTVYIYQNIANSYSLISTLIPADAAAADLFGQALVLNDTTLYVGAPLQSTTQGVQAGAVYVFSRSNTVWTQSGKLTGGNALITGSQFGAALALDNSALSINGAALGNNSNTLLVSAPKADANAGRLYLYQGTNLVADFTAPDVSAQYGVGTSIALASGYAMVGAPRASHMVNNAGAVYAFQVGTSPLSSSGLSNTVTIDTMTSSGTLFVGSSNASIVNVGINASTINVGTGTNPTTINIGASGDTVNILGSTNYIAQSNLAVANTQLLLNSNAPANSAALTGLHVLEAGTTTAYARTTADRSSWELKAPAANGVVTLAPGANNITVSADTLSKFTPTTAGSSNVFKLTGNVGIGTSNPQVPLDVVGNVQLGSVANGTVGNISAGNLTGFRNRIINGDMRLDTINRGSNVVVGPDMGYTPVVSLNGTMSNFGWTNASNRPTFDTSNNMVTFNRSGSQYLDAGSKTFNMAVNGFTCTAVVMFTGTAGSWERIIDFASGSPNNNIFLSRYIAEDRLNFDVRIGSGGTNAVFTATGTLLQNVVYCVTATITPTGTSTIYINGAQSVTGSVVAPTNRTLTNTYIGRSAWVVDAYLNTNIFFLSAYDACFTAAQVQQQYQILSSSLFNRQNLIPYSLPTVAPEIPTALVSLNPASYNTTNWSQSAAQTPLIDTTNKLITFDKGRQQHLALAGAARTYTVSSTGFTVSTVVRFPISPAPVSGETIFAAVTGTTDGNGLYNGEFINLYLGDTGQNNIYFAYKRTSNAGAQGVNYNFGNVSGGWSPGSIVFVTFTISSTGTMTLYVNGVISTTVNLGFTPTDITAANTFIGRSYWQANGHPYLSGNIYFLEAYNATLTSTQVSQQYNMLASTLFNNNPTVSANTAIHPVSPVVHVSPLLGSYPWTTNTATFDSVNNVVTFDRSKSQYLDAGRKRFDMGTNGFTATAVVMMTGTPSTYERIWEFGSGTLDYNYIARNGTEIGTEYSNGSTLVASQWTNTGPLQQHVLTAITLVINNTGVRNIYVNGISVSSASTGTPPTNRTFTSTSIGRSVYWNAYFGSMNLYFFAAYDATFTPTEVLNQYNALSALIRPYPFYQTVATNRFLVYHDVLAGNGAILAAQDTDVPAAFSTTANSLRLTNTAAGLSLNDYAGVSQRLEGFNVQDFGWGTATPSSATLSMWVKSSVTGDYMVSVTPDETPANAQVMYVTKITINNANTWEYKTVSIASPSSVNTVWPRDSRYAIRVNLHLAGTNSVWNNQTATTNTWTQNIGYDRLSGAANFLGVQNAVLRLTGVQLEKGTLATAFEQRNVAQEQWLNGSMLVGNTRALVTEAGASDLTVNGSVYALSNLGVGTSNPQAPLHVDGRVLCSYVQERHKPSGIKMYHVAGYLDVSAVNTAYRQFCSGFCDEHYGYLVGNYNNSGHHGNLVRFDINQFNASSVVGVDVAAVSANARGFVGGCSDGRYAYMIPHHNDTIGHHGLLARVDLHNFTSSGVSVFDMTSVNTLAKGYSGGVIVNKHLYLAPHYNGNYSGLVCRVDLNTFSSSGFAFLDVSIGNTFAKGFIGAFSHKNYVYLVPYYHGTAYAGVVARIDINNFTQSGISYLDVSQGAFSNATGFQFGFTDGKYGYLVPHYASSGHHGMLVRIDLSNFTLNGVSYLNLHQINSNYRGFIGGFTDSRYAYLVPHYNGAYTGIAVRIDLNDFTVNGITPLDLSQGNSGAKGFHGGFTNGRFGFYIPHYYDGTRSGIIARINLSQYHI